MANKEVSFSKFDAEIWISLDDLIDLGSGFIKSSNQIWF